MSYFDFTIGKIEIVREIFSAFGWNMELIAKWALAVLIIHVPANLFIQYYIGEYKPRDNQQLIIADKKAGRQIGSIERLIMLLFLSKNQYAAIGFVLS